MLFLPGSCETCTRVQLVSAESCIEGKAQCGTCGGLVFALGGLAYSEEDVPLFDELCTAVARAHLAPLEAAQLALALSDAAVGNDEQETVELAMFWFPALAPLRAILESNPSRAREAVIMLDTILWERSKTRESLVVPKRGGRGHAAGG